MTLGPGDADFVRVREEGTRGAVVSGGGWEMLRVRRSGSRELLRVRAMVLVLCGWWVVERGGGESVDGDAIWRLVNRVVTHVPAGGFQVSLRCYDQQLPRRGSWRCGGGVCRVGILVVGLEGGVVVVSCTIVFGGQEVISYHSLCDDSGIVVFFFL